MIRPLPDRLPVRPTAAPNKRMLTPLSFAAYAVRVRKWLIAAGAIVLAAAVALTVWAVIRPDGPSTASTAAEAVEATCDANGATQLSPKTDPKAFGHRVNLVAVPKYLIPVYWEQDAGPAVHRRAHPGKTGSATSQSRGKQQYARRPLAGSRSSTARLFGSCAERRGQRGRDQRTVTPPTLRTLGAHAADVITDLAVVGRRLPLVESDTRFGVWEVQQLQRGGAGSQRR